MLVTCNTIRLWLIQQFWAQKLVHLKFIQSVCIILISKIPVGFFSVIFTQNRSFTEIWSQTVSFPSCSYQASFSHKFDRDEGGGKFSHCISQPNSISLLFRTLCPFAVSFSSLSYAFGSLTTRRYLFARGSDCENRWLWTGYCQNALEWNTGTWLWATIWLYSLDGMSLSLCSMSVAVLHICFVFCWSTFNNYCLKVYEYAFEYWSTPLSEHMAGSFRPQHGRSLTFMLFCTCSSVKNYPGAITRRPICLGSINVVMIFI